MFAHFMLIRRNVLRLLGGTVFTGMAAGLPLWAGTAKAEVAGPDLDIDIFVNGQEGYPYYRIPALIVAPDGSVLAFAEGRKDNNGDQGGVDVVLKRSFDGGANWSPLQVVAGDGPNTVGNPTVVLDGSTGTIWLLLCWNYGDDNEAAITSGTARGTRQVWVTSSGDNGASWSAPVDITGTTKLDSWGWYATGPGVGIQLSSGRLLIPCDHTVLPNATNYSHVIYSDDHGANWQVGGTVGVNVNECQAVERVDGSVLINMRNEYGVSNYRAQATSGDGGQGWSEIMRDGTLIEPQCQASILRYSRQDAGGDANRLLFSNPASTERQNMTVRVSYDEGGSWSAGKVIYASGSAYSCLTVLPGGMVGLLYERGNAGADPSEYSDRIGFTRFSLDWLAS